MNRVTMRRLARHKLGDLSTTDPIYSDSDYNTALLHSAYYVQARLAKVNAVPFTGLQVTNLTSGVGDYPVPPDMTTPGVRRLYVLSSNGVYVPAVNRNLEDLEDGVRDAAVAQVGEDPTTPSIRPQYAVDGDYIVVSPTPTASTANGLRIRFAKVVTMADDTSVPQLPLVLHDAIWLHAAAKFAPQQDFELIKTLASQYNEIINTFIDAFKNRFGNEPEQIESVGDVDKIGWKDPQYPSATPTRY